MNCFICGNIMIDDYYDGPLKYCENKDHTCTFGHDDSIQFEFNKNDLFYFELNIINFTLKAYSNEHIDFDKSIDISEIIYWRTSKELKDYVNKVFTFK